MNLSSRLFPVELACVMVLSSACGGSGSTGGPNGPSGPNGTSCRTYPTSMTSVSSGGPSTVVTTVSGTHNTATHQTTYNVSYSDSAGLQYSFVQVTTYRSTEEFVDEVKVNPPLTLSVGTVDSGGLSLTLTNTYDAQRRLTGFTTAVPGSTITTTYSAWDASGRPTAGTRTGSGPLTLAYNDTARVQTVTIGGLGTEVTTFDANGNVISLAQNYGAATVTTTTTIASTAVVCK